MRRLTIRRLMLWVAVSACVCAFLIFVLPMIPSGARINYIHAQCMNNLRNISYAIQAYHDDYGCFPPAYIADASGKPMHSWRVLILPYLDEQALYNDYDFAEPWDGPHNRTLAGRMPRILGCPGDRRGPTLTAYLAITGPGTAFPGAGMTSLANIRDDPASTILLAESTDAAVPWMEPRDLDLNALRLAAPGVRPPTLCSPHKLGPMAAFADLTVRPLDRSLSPKALRALATIRGGEAVPFP